MVRIVAAFAGIALATASMARSLPAEKPRVLIIGDSWGVISPAPKDFKMELSDHQCSYEYENIAVSGTTATDWTSNRKLKSVREKSANADHVWVTLGGNDAKNFAPGCAAQHKSASECTTELIDKLEGQVGTILDTIHESNPNAKVVGFGYDLMFGAELCHLVARAIFPQCWNSTETPGNPIRCFNSQFISIQAMWERLAGARAYVTAINVLGATQIAAGGSNATIGQPDLDKFGPAKYWPITTGCIHPSTGTEGSGGMQIMKEFYSQYWSQALNC